MGERHPGRESGAAQWVSNSCACGGARDKPPGTSVLDFLKMGYASIPLQRIDSVFGFFEKSALYGGRPFQAPELSQSDVEELYSAKIGVRIPLTNHYAEREEYLENRQLLEHYHRKGNSVIITNDNLARWIREDFPKYRIEANVIKNIDFYQMIKDALKLYDTVVLPMRLNEDTEFLSRVMDKKHITLFGNAGCTLTCQSKICYPSISKLNKYKGGEFKCSQTLKYRQMHGMIDFDLEKLIGLGFSRFKLLRPRPGGGTGY